MHSPHSILLVPDDSDPLRLLAEGLCGALPPIADAPIPHDQHPCLVQCPRVGAPAPISKHKGVCYECGRPATARALVLAWDGVVVPEGCDRHDNEEQWPKGRTADVVDSIMVGDAGSDFWAGSGRLIFLDSTGQEIPHE